MSYTKGPWKVKSDRYHYDTMSDVVGGEYNPLRKPFSQLHVAVGGFSDVPEQEANARLIAAAPELLEALQNLLSVLPDVNISHPSARASHEAWKVIAKATGKSS